MSKARVIAFYLPQFHPTVDNDNWWGKGFTEWTNVGKAKPLFKGHYQPKVPADLGYYDLRLPIVRSQQADMARKAGVEGFCYYHYWFGEGKQELELPFDEVVNSGQPDYPFCLCWANESWHSKFWNIDGTVQKKMLIEQKYLGKEDNEMHFYSLLPAFKDKRYMKYRGKQIFMIYKPLEFKGVEVFIKQWNQLASKNGLEGFHFIAHTLSASEIDILKTMGFDAVNLLRLNNFVVNETNKLRRNLIFMMHRLFKKPFVYNYKTIIPCLVGKEESLPNVYPSLIPNWDHTPRSGYGGYLLQDSEPLYFDLHLKQVLSIVSNKDYEDKIVFLKSWNEWGEGNYVEPDLRYGHGYLDVLQSNLVHK